MCGLFPKNIKQTILDIKIDCTLCQLHCLHGLRQWDYNFSERYTEPGSLGCIAAL